MSTDAPMSAADVLDAIHHRWPADQYLTIPEAPQNPDRTGRKIDALIVSLWRSRGFALDAVEIKVSVSDWRRELKHPEKAEWWWSHTDRFWIACPPEIAPKIKPELPPGWGLLACTPKTTRAVVTPARNDDRKPLSWQTTVGILRASSGISTNALHRSWTQGRTEGIKEAERLADRRSGDSALRMKAERLEAKIRDFEKASGIDLSQEWDARRAGELYRIASDVAGMNGPSHLIRSLERQVEQIQRIASDLGSVVGAFSLDN